LTYVKYDGYHSIGGSALIRLGPGENNREGRGWLGSNQSNLKEGCYACMLARLKYV
jgi:hypothetical protein